MKGKVVHDYYDGDFSKQEITDIINKRKQDLMDFMKRFEEIDTFIHEFKEEAIKIDAAKKTVAEI